MVSDNLILEREMYEKEISFNFLLIYQNMLIVFLNIKLNVKVKVLFQNVLFA